MAVRRDIHKAAKRSALAFFLATRRRDFTGDMVEQEIGPERGGF